MALLLVARAIPVHAEQLLEISALHAGRASEGIERSLADGLAASLSARQGIKAQALSRPDSFDFTRVHQRSTLDQFVSFVCVGFGKRVDLLALRFEQPGGPVSVAVRRASRVGQDGRFDHFPPGPFQLPDNAVKELAADLERDLAQPLTGDQIVQIQVTPWTSAFADEMAEAGNGQDLAGITALSFVAVAQTGWRATTHDSPIKLQIQAARRMPSGFDLRVRSVGVPGARQLTQINVNEEELFENLVNLCSFALDNAPILACVQMHPNSTVRLLTVDKGIAVGSVGAGQLIGFDLNKRDAAWQIEAPSKGSVTWASGQGRLYRQQDAAIFNIATGEGRTMVRSDLLTPWSIRLPNPASVNTAILITHEGLQRIDGDAVTWSFPTRVGMSCGPVIAGDRVVAGDRNGTVVSLALASGQPAWTTQLDGRLVGPGAFLAGKVLLADDMGGIHAINPSDGSIAWTYNLGDTLIAPPCEAGSAILVGSAGGRLALLDPATGAEKAVWSQKLWISGLAVTASPAASWIAVTTHRGQLLLLDPDSLTVQHTLQLPSRSLNGLLFSARTPIHQDGDLELGQDLPALLTADDRGFVYILAIPGR